MTKREYCRECHGIKSVTIEDVVACSCQPTPDAPPAPISELVVAAQEIDEIVALFPVAGDGTQERRVVLDESDGMVLASIANKLRRALLAFVAALVARAERAERMFEQAERSRVTNAELYERALREGDEARARLSQVEQQRRELEGRVAALREVREELASMLIPEGKRKPYLRGLHGVAIVKDAIASLDALLSGGAPQQESAE